MARWEDTLDHQMELWQWWRSEQGARFAKGWSQDKGTKYNRDDLRAENQVREIQETIMFHAEPIAVEPDMMTLIEAAQQSFQPEPLRETDLITLTGFIVLPRPIVSKDIWGRQVSFRAFGWMPALRTKAIPESPAMEVAASMMGWGTETYGIWLGLYTHIDDPDSYTQEQFERHGEARVRANMPTLSLFHQEVWRFGEDYTKEPPGGWAGIHDGSLYKEAGIDFQAALDHRAEQFRVLQSIFRLMQQTIAVHATHHPDRATRRRAARAEYPEKEVTVIYLRRPRRDDYQEPTTEAERKSIDWQSRWLVAGHWRNQYYASLGEHRQIWINPYIKGPEDKPLRVREKRAFVFGR